MSGPYNGAMKIWLLITLLPCLIACQRTESAAFDPLAQALASKRRIHNREAVIPPQCYTKTDGRSNPCWVCHTTANGRNALNDVGLQEQYDFSETGKINHWTNLFVDRREAMARISDAEVLAYVRQDNYSPLRSALVNRSELHGWQPDLDLRQGFDAEGFARDGSGWRAFRYQPFPGTFWPTNGSADDVMIRLPRVYRLDLKGRESREIYKINLAIVEAAVATDSRWTDAQVNRRIEPIDESAAGFDLNGDGRISTRIERIKGLPLHYAGAAAGVGVGRGQYPLGTEFLHSVRYLDPDTPALMATRMKELRYAAKMQWLNPDGLRKVYEEEAREKKNGLLPAFPGTPMSGLLSPFGWQLQAYIEDPQGRLRLQTHEEQQFCMGCHGALGVTVDSSFSFPRKVPGNPGWQHQTLEGLIDLPQAGHQEPEILTYFKRAGGGDEFRANQEILERFFPDGRLDESRVRSAKDIRDLISPSRRRALDLNKAYMALVQAQGYEQGRDTVLSPAKNVHRRIENGDTGLRENQSVYEDGRLWLEWPASMN